MSKELYNNKSKEELHNILSDKQVELGKLTFIKSDPSQKSNSAFVTTLRRDIARIKTLLNQSSK